LATTPAAASEASATTPAAASEASATTPAAAAETEDRLESADCPVEVPPEHADRVSCSILTVPERRTPDADPEKTLQLPVAVISSAGREPTDDPLVFPTSGGPGGSSLGVLWYFLDHADWAGDRDIIVVEQRGDALANPTLDCPELDTEHFIVEGGALLGGSAAAERWGQQLSACHSRLIEQGVDLAAYTSAESVADLVDLRAALEYDEWNLYGVSYGSRLALTVMRDHPEGLRSVILDGPFPPNINWFETLPTGFMTALDALVAQCADDAACDEHYPQLRQSLGRLLDSAADAPIPVTVKNPADGSPLRVDVSDVDLTGGLFDALYDPDVLRALPYLIDQLERGNTSSMIPLAQRSIDGRGILAEGLDMSVTCAEEAPFNDDAFVAEALTADPILEHFEVRSGFRQDCATWAVPPLAAVENQAVASDVPTFIANGGYDPVTPLAYGEAAATQLSHAYLYEFPAMGHGSVWANWIDPCPASMAEQFLADPATEPDSSCIAAMPATVFLTTDDIHPTTAIYRFADDVVQDPDPWQVGIAVATVLVLIATLVYALGYGLSWLVRRGGDAPPVAVLAAGFGFVLTRTDPLILAFGVPPAARVLVIAALIAIALTVLLAVLLVRAWRLEEGSRFHRVALTVSAAGSVAFAIWVIARGLLIF
jgi:pimeloyl-ACP methyl ester carboxylesterase